MPEQPDDFPPLHEYALAHRCSTCGAVPGVPCEAPRKQAGVAQRAALRERFGQEPVEENPLRLMHAPRVDAGLRHYRKDQAAAPWPEDREPGRRYDTLDKLQGDG